MSRTSPQMLANIIKRISDITDIPNSRAAAIEKDKPHYLWLENAPMYGGYRLVLVDVKSGAHSGAFGGTGSEPRRKPKEMESYLQGLLYGLVHGLVYDL